MKIDEENLKKAGYYLGGHFANIINKLTGIRRRINKDCKKYRIDPSNLEKKTEFLKRSVGYLHLEEPEYNTPLSAMTSYELYYLRKIILGDDSLNSREL